VLRTTDRLCGNQEFPCFKDEAILRSKGIDYFKKSELIELICKTIASLCTTAQASHCIASGRRGAEQRSLRHKPN
jgi:hypothetical protein